MAESSRIREKVIADFKLVALEDERLRAMRQAEPATAVYQTERLIIDADEEALEAASVNNP